MTPNKLPPLPMQQWIAVDTTGADFDTTFVRTTDEADDMDEGETPSHRELLFTADQMHAYAAEALRQSQSLPAGAVAGLVGKWREHEHAGNSSWGDGYMAAMKDCAFDLEQALQAADLEECHRHSCKRKQAIQGQALGAIVSAVRRYLPPDGISKDELISAVIAAIDNQEINSELK